MIKTTIVVNLISFSMANIDADINAGQYNAKIQSGPKKVNIYGPLSHIKNVWI